MKQFLKSGSIALAAVAFVVACSSKPPAAPPPRLRPRPFRPPWS